MKRMVSLLFLCLTLLISPLKALATPQWPDSVSIEADAGILMDADTGTILYGKDIDTPYYPASITKMLTALIVLKHCSMDELVEFSHDDVYNVEAGSSSAGVDEGDVLTVEDCLYGLMLASANECANALARHVSGSREAFAELMNETAKELGCTGSHFSNPSGLNDENHYTTAHDMALIAQEAIKNPDFLRINITRSHQLAPTKRSPQGGYVANHHKMLMKHEAVYYPGAFAGKTGYTSLAGNTLVTCAERNGLRLIAVVLHCNQTHYADTKALFNFGFANFRSINVSEYETSYKSIENDMTIGGMTAQDNITLELARNESILLPKDAVFSDASSSLSYELDADAPSDAIAQIQYTYEGRPVGRVHLLYPGLTAVRVKPGAENADSERVDSGNIGTENVGSRNTGSETNVFQDAASETAVENGKSVKNSPVVILELSAASEVPISGRSVSQLFNSLKEQFKSPRTRMTALAAAVVLLVAAIVIILKIRAHKKEQENLLLRRKQRLDRLEDMGFSASEFDKLVAQKRNSSLTNHGLSKPHKSRRRKKSLFR